MADGESFADSQIIGIQTGPLSKKVVHSGIWVFSLSVFNRGLAFIRTIVLARLLAPQDFGLLGIAMLALSTLETFSQTGFHAALVQKREHIKSYLDTAWTIAAIRGIALFIILFSLAPIISQFFNSPQSTPIIRVVASFMLLYGFRNIGVLFFQKELEFQKQFFVQFSANLVDLSVAISLAFILRNVWALVLAGLAANIFWLIFSYLMHPYRPHISFEKEKFEELFSFGKWIIGSGILVFLVTQGDDLFVAKVIGVTALGFYQMAFTISNLPATEITHVISKVTFPAFSKLQDDLSRLREAYLRVLQMTTFVSLPLAGGIFVLASEFTQIFLGNKWMPIVPVMQILVVAGLIRSVAATTGPLLHGVGKPKVETMWQIVRLFVLAALIYPLTIQWGIVGTSIAVLFSNLVSTFGFCLLTIEIIRSSKKAFAKIIILPLINTMTMVSILLGLRSCTDVRGVLGFLLMIGTGMLCYLLIACLFEIFLNYGMRRIIRENIASK